MGAFDLIKTLPPARVECAAEPSASIFNDLSESVHQQTGNDMPEGGERLGPCHCSNAYLLKGKSMESKEAHSHREVDR